MKNNNIKDYNTGDYNTGYSNIGNRNTGYSNTGYYNFGNRNTGDYNSGNYNSGNCNTGYYNTGDYNSGYYNSGDRNTGIFNTDKPKMRAFNKETDMTMSEWENSDYYIYFDIPLNVWRAEAEMTDEEKKDNVNWEQMGGYLKTLDYKDAWAEWWKENGSEEMIKKIKRLPNFDSKIFEEITGIQINEPQEMIKIDGKMISVGTIKEALKLYFN